ncbi:hypothetical protein SAMN06265379_10787 [Saccharicrinis carchari]|uniref:Uncharacterized protein n=1 Tax=Saccharicrinis carchari TaxID=1168039 RepID=A0A521E2J2_SACCC|nr:hypothetical protein SAMN06265379_10787 [Saccharicrinis carchari]
MFYLRKPLHRLLLSHRSLAQNKGQAFKLTINKIFPLLLSPRPASAKLPLAPTRLSADKFFGTAASGATRKNIIRRIRLLQANNRLPILRELIVPVLFFFLY